ncbi:cation:proton antiporter [Nitratireductor aquimarinus]|uniref:cation:proton antiporter n=1 Tax=Alphaproteobacteria TaxID=28211 RepID=UPI0019D37B2F|nr:MULTISPECIES: cation:proton antiporter [Alphaproteobacteria]MBN7757429.1 cation:proton antiporter [Nitratireductor aquimarinus]MBY6000189.1 cation:proton antiporter [Tritonibacter mobilis]MBY6022218.1 cation:proton antiporter [Nitratireductor sp. DP7N14-4]
MEAEAHAFPLTEIAFVLLVAIALGLGLMRLKQPPLVGFILAGVVMGPTGFGLIGNSDSVTALAEMGVLMLLFFIGMELSLRAFIMSLKPAVLVAVGQLAVALAIGLSIAWMGGTGLSEGIIFGFIIGLSSTVVAMKMLSDMDELRRDAGRIAIAVLIAQDIAVVPMLIIVSALGGADTSLLAIAAKVALAVGFLGWLLWWLGRRGKLRLPFAAAIADNVEILALGALGVCFGAAALSGFLGLSPAYGAFVAGILVGNSNLRARIIPVIEPIQSILVVIFFLSIGLLFDLTYIWNNLWMVLGAALLVIAAKTLLNVFLLRATGHDRNTALIGGLSMAQIGEFSFVLAAAGLSAGALGQDSYRLAIAVTAISLLFSPAWMSVMRRIDYVAAKGFSSYREALSEAYAEEIGNVGEGLWWVRARYRAGRLTLRKWRARRALEKAAKAARKKEEKAEKEAAEATVASEAAEEKPRQPDEEPAAGASKENA